MHFPWTRSSPEAAAFNYALKLALEWGENFGEPIQERLRAKFPEIDATGADALAAQCEEVKRHAFALMASTYPHQPRVRAFHRTLRQRYPHIDADNAGNLLTQGQYFAWRSNG